MTNETHTLQTWPSGQSFEYRGDPNGPPDQRQIRTPERRTRGLSENLTVATRPRWRKGKADEWAQIIHSRRAERYSDVEIFCCDSCLVDDLLKAAACGMDREAADLGDGFAMEEIRNLYPNPDAWDAAECRDWLEEHGIEICEQVDDPDLIDDVRSAVRDNAEPAEVMEWWRVSSWLCGQLHEIGEVTIDNNYGYWWGRQATGQGYLMDGVLQRVAARFD
ncbi:hypothetical protein LCGC14_1477800 [marine sediment metagenome]|uniref:Uncharacterized protein n=1 Tax=marine sediment metagenome TaxID=412755 RepID=A0A0F9MC68_9ZZZZ